MAVIKYNKKLRKVRKTKGDWSDSDIESVEVADQDLDTVLVAGTVNYENGCLSYSKNDPIDTELDGLIKDAKKESPAMFALLKHLNII